MTTLTDRRAIIDYCLAPLELGGSSDADVEVRKRLDHALKAFQLQAARPVAVDFSTLRTQVIDEAAFGNE